MLQNYIIILFNITIPTGILGGGPVALTYLLLGAVTFFIPCAVVTAQLAVIFPYEGALYNWTHHALGGFWSFFSGFCAWLSAVLIILAGPNLLVAYLQFMNPRLVLNPVQQGLLIIGLILFSALLAIQRSRIIQIITNVMTGLLFLAVPMVFLAGVTWIATGHPSATNFSHLGDWSVQPANYVLFGFTTFAYLSTEVPLNLAGEMRRQNREKNIKSHLLWGTLLVLLGYLLSTWAMLAVQGPNASASATALYTPVSTVDMALGKLAGTLTAFFIMCYFLLIPTIFSSMSSRLLLVGSIDRLLPTTVGRLNKHRSPASAIRFQTILITVLAALIFVAVPLLFGVSNANAENFTVEAYQVVVAAATLIWAISVTFLFIDVMLIYLKDRRGFHQRRIFPMPVLWACIVVGPLACLAAIIDTLYYSWIPTLIPTAQWWLIVSGLSLACVLVAVIWGLFANSQANYENTFDTLRA